MTEIGSMKTSHQIVRDFVAEHAIDMADFNGWFADAGYPEEEANVHDSRYLAHMEDYVAERALSRHP